MSAVCLAGDMAPPETKENGDLVIRFQLNKTGRCYTGRMTAGEMEEGWTLDR